MKFFAVQAKLDWIQQKVEEITGPEPTAADWAIIWSTLGDTAEMERQLRAARAPRKMGKFLMFPGS